MSWTKCAALALVLGIGSAGFVTPAFAEDMGAADKPEKKETEKPAKKEEKKEVKGPKVFGIWGKLSSLTAEQKIKIKEIHDKFLEDRKKLEQQEEADIAALLTDEQKLELQGIKEEEAAKRKAKDVEKKSETKKDGETKDGMQ